MTYSSIRNVQSYFCEQEQKLLIKAIVEFKYRKYKLNSQKLEFVYKKISACLKQLKSVEIAKDSKYFLLPLENFRVNEKHLEINKLIRCRIYPIECLAIDSYRKIDFLKTKGNIQAFQRAKNSGVKQSLWLFSWEDIMSSKILVLDSFTELDILMILSNLFWDLTYLGFDKKIVDSRRHRQKLLDKLQKQNPSASDRLFGKHKFLEGSIEKSKADTFVKNKAFSRISPLSHLASLNAKSRNMNTLSFDKFFDTAIYLHI